MARGPCLKEFGSEIVAPGSGVEAWDLANTFENRLMYFRQDFSGHGFLKEII